MTARTARDRQRAELLKDLRYQTQLSLRIAGRRDVAVPIVEAVAHGELAYARVWNATPEMIKARRSRTILAALVEVGVTDEAIEARKAEIAAELPAMVPQLSVVGGIE